jgi:hypothetical protein
MGSDGDRFNCRVGRPVTTKTWIFLFLSLAALGWLLWSASTHGKVWSRYGIPIERKREPTLFWLWVAVYGFGFLIVAVCVLGELAIKAISN